MSYTDNLWLKEEPTDNGWIKGQIRSFNARLGDAVVGGHRAPLPADMIAWHADILDVRAKYARRHAQHTEDNSDFGCRQCHIAGWEVDTSLPKSEQDAILALA